MPAAWKMAAIAGLSVCGATPIAAAADLKVGTDTNYIQLYGQFDKGFLHYDDGQSPKWYPMVDNDSSSSRFGVRISDRRENDVTIGANAEFEWEPYSTGDVNQLTAHEVDFAAVGLRKAEIHLSHAAAGKIWAGHGSMASDGTSEVDLSGTGLAGYASVGDIAGGQYFRFAGGALSNSRIYDAFSDLDGLGRNTRMRYDTPSIHGFSVGASMDIDRSWDIALSLDNRLGEFALAGAAAYSDDHDSGSELSNGSFSVLHDPTGLSLTVAAGIGLTREPDPQFVYGKLGYQADWFDAGRSYLSLDAYSGHDIGAPGSRSRSWGFAMVQNVALWRADYYVGLRTYQYDEPGLSYRDGRAIIFGARVAF